MAANFKASSSRFVFGIVLLVLVVINNRYPAAPAAAAAAACSGIASNPMLFNSSSSLEAAVEEVAKDQRTPTEIVVDHEIRGRVLQGSTTTRGFKFIFKLIGKGLKQFQPSPDAAYDQNAYYRFLDGICSNAFCYPVAMYICECSLDFKQVPDNNPCIYEKFYCCQGTNGTCTNCCQGNAPVGTRYNILSPPNLPSDQGSSSSSSSSSGSPLAYIVMAVVIAIFTIIPSMFYLLLI